MYLWQTKSALKEILAREERLTSRAKILEALAAGTGEEVKVQSSILGSSDNGGIEEVLVGLSVIKVLKARFRDFWQLVSNQLQHVKVGVCSRED